MKIVLTLREYKPGQYSALTIENVGEIAKLKEIIRLHFFMMMNLKISERLISLLARS